MLFILKNIPGICGDRATKYLSETDSILVDMELSRSLRTPQTSHEAIVIGDEVGNQ